MNKNDGLINSIFIFSPIILLPVIGYVALFFSFENINFLLLALGVLFFGFSLLIFSKFSMIRKGIFFSWGSKDMKPISKILYRLGYFFIILGVAASIFLIVS